jgi:hypothetical protein
MRSQLDTSRQARRQALPGSRLIAARVDRVRPRRQLVGRRKPSLRPTVIGAPVRRRGHESLRNPMRACVPSTTGGGRTFMARLQHGVAEVLPAADGLRCAKPHRWPASML